MGEHWEWIEHRGKRILFAKFAGIKDESVYLEAIADLEREILKQPKGQVVPLLMDVTNTRMSMAVTNRGKQMVQTARAYGIVDGPTALIGLTAAQKAVVATVRLIRPETQAANSLKEAKDWIVDHLK